MQLRNSLIHGDSQTFSAYSNVEDNKEDGGYDSGVNDFGDEMPHDMYMDDDLPLHQEQVRLPVLMCQEQNIMHVYCGSYLLKLVRLFVNLFPA